MRAVPACLSGLTAVLASITAAAAQQPLPGVVEIAPEAVAHVPLAERGAVEASQLVPVMNPKARRGMAGRVSWGGRWARGS
jgi:hypothetical protein